MDRRVRLRRGRTAAWRAVAIGVALATLGGCSIFGSKKQPPCPKVSVLADASTLTRFRPGPGRDITDVELKAEITGFHGSCTWDNDKRILSVALQLTMDVSRGPAARGRETELDYFVAIPALYPNPDAKKILPVKLAFPDSAQRMHVTDNEVDVNLPIKDLKNDLDKYVVFLGLQLDQAQLDYNLRRKGQQP